LCHELSSGWVDDDGDGGGDDDDDLPLKINTQLIPLV
jgi:hypothetical protein